MPRLLSSALLGQGFTKPSSPENGSCLIAGQCSAYIRNRHRTGVTDLKADLRADLVEAQQALAELATEAEGQAQEIGELSATLDAERQNAAGLRGELIRLQEERDQARRETRQEREIAEGLRIELAKASLQLEPLPALQAELSSERSARIAAEKQVAVLEERIQWAPSPSRG